MTPAKADSAQPLAEKILNAFDTVNGGPHPGFRAAHAKGILLSGSFSPSPDAAALTSAPHIQSSSTPVSVRFSDFTGIPAIPDGDPNASPRGLAVRFHLAEHVHTDIVAHSADGFPARTAEEFVEFLHAAAASGPGVAHPTPIEAFLGTHPSALEFVMMPKPTPSSFAKESFFSVTAYKFVSKEGTARYGRYKIRPVDGNEFLDAETLAKQGPDFLFEDIKVRIGKGPVKLNITVQIAAEGDVVDNATIHWPNDRPEIAFGTVELTSVVENNDAEQRHIIFDPIPRVEGIETSGDPLLEPRADVYLMSGRRRRAGQ